MAPLGPTVGILRESYEDTIMQNWDCLFKVALHQILFHQFFYGWPLAANHH